jgi:hypothetical protein
MKTIRNIVGIFMAIFVFSFVDINAQSFSDRGSQSVKSIEQQIFRKINGLPYYGVFDHIAFEVKPGNRVILYGKVNSLGTKRDAEKAVRRIAGVQSVENRIINLPPSSFDSQIRRGIVRNFVSSAGLYGYLREPSPSVRIIVENGRVTLEGYVSNRGTANLMGALANQVPGVFNVRNNLVIGNGRDR